VLQNKVEEWNAFAESRRVSARDEMMKLTKFYEDRLKQNTMIAQQVENELKGKINSVTIHFTKISQKAQNFKKLFHKINKTKLKHSTLCTHEKSQKPKKFKETKNKRKLGKKGQNRKRNNIAEQKPKQNCKYYVLCLATKTEEGDEVRRKRQRSNTTEENERRRKTLLLICSLNFLSRKKKSLVQQDTKISLSIYFILLYFLKRWASKFTLKQPQSIGLGIGKTRESFMRMKLIKRKNTGARSRETV